MTDLSEMFNNYYETSPKPCQRLDIKGGTTRERVYQIVGIPVTLEQLVTDVLEEDYDNADYDPYEVFDRINEIFQRTGTQCRVYKQPCCFYTDKDVPTKFIVGMRISVNVDTWPMCFCMDLFNLSNITEEILYDRLSKPYNISTNCQPTIDYVLSKNLTGWNKYLIDGQVLKKAKLTDLLPYGSEEKSQSLKIFEKLCKRPTFVTLMEIHDLNKRYNFSAGQICNIFMSDDCYSCS